MYLTSWDHGLDYTDREMKIKSKSQIDIAYTKLLQSFRTAASGSGGCVVRLSNSRGFISKNTSADCLVVESSLFLPNWKYRSSATGKRINILVRGNEFFNFDSGFIKSTIQVMYLEIDVKRDAVPLLGLHYDFEEAVLPAHPCFHVQFGVSDVSSEECRAIGLHASILPPKEPFYPSIRIPTPHMSLSGVLVGIAADHLSNRCATEFMVAVRSNNLRHFGTSCGLLESNYSNHGGHQWHPHLWYST